MGKRQRGRESEESGRDSMSKNSQFPPYVNHLIACK